MPMLMRWQRRCRFNRDGRPARRFPIRDPVDGSSDGAICFFSGHSDRVYDNSAFPRDVARKGVKGQQGWHPNVQKSPQGSLLARVGHATALASPTCRADVHHLRDRLWAGRVHSNECHQTPRLHSVPCPSDRAEPSLPAPAN